MSQERTDTRIKHCTTIGMKMVFGETGGPWGFTTDAIPGGHLDSIDVMFMDDEEFVAVTQKFEDAIKQKGE